MKATLMYGTCDVRIAGRGDAVRVPQACGTLLKLPVAADPALLPSLMTLTDVFCTGRHAAVTARAGPGFERRGCR